MSRKAEQGYAEMLKTSASCMSTVSTATKLRRLLVSFEGSRIVTSSCRHDLIVLVSVCNKMNGFLSTCTQPNCRHIMALRNLFKNDLVLVGTNLTVVAGFATFLGKRLCPYPSSYIYGVTPNLVIQAPELRRS